MSIKPVLALDFGGKTGWAIGTPASYDSGVVDIRPRRGESCGMRYVRIRSHLNAMLSAYPRLSAICYEQAHHRGGAATEYALGCIATMQAWCADHSIEHWSEHSSKIKIAATGNGNAPKDAVMAAVIEKLNRRPGDDNEADAIWLLQLAFQRLDGR